MPSKSNSLTSIEEELQSSRRRRSKRRLSSFIVSLFILALSFVLGGWWVVVKSNLFLIQDIAISGNREVGREEILAFLREFVERNSKLAGWIGSDNLLAWPDEIPSDEFLKLPLIENLEIKKDFGKRSVSVRVFERSPYGVWCQKTRTDTVSSSLENNDWCAWFDREGMLFKPMFEVEGSLIPAVDDYTARAIGLGTKILSEGYIANLFSVFDVLREAEIAVEEIRLVDLNLREVEVRSYDGPILYFSLEFTASYIPQVIRSLREKADFQTLKYIDFRVMNRVYYR